MRTAIAALALAVAALGGCARALDVSGEGWTRPGAGVAEVSWDEMECVRAASDAGHTPDLVVGGLVDVWRNAVREGGRAAVYRRCMAGKGYRPASDPARG